jgi:hypothetical protein
VLLLVLLFVLSEACTNRPDEFFDYRLDHVVGVNTIEEALHWVHYNIDYQHEELGKDEWQTPEQTLDMRKGDCEDYCILFMYLAFEEVGGCEPAMLCCRCYFCGLYHAMVKINDVVYDPVGMGIEDLRYWQILAQFDYETTLMMAIIR